MDDPSADDLLIEILLRLPAKSLFSLKCVSKRWCRIISSSFFLHLYQSQRTAQFDSLLSLLGFFQSEARDAFIPAYALGNNDCAKFPRLANNGDSFFGASNGLLLYYNHHYMAYHVCNPVTKQCLSLPQPQYNHFNAAIGFDVEESCGVKVELEKLKFKVVCIVLASLTEPSNNMQIESFSSDTNSWRDCRLKPAIGSILVRPREYAVMINGVYYWLECMSRVLVYDSNSNPGLEEDIGQVIPLPDRNIGTRERSSVLGKSKDGLLQYGGSDTFKIVVWVLESAVDRPRQWVLRHTISFMLLHYRYPGIMSSCDLILSREDLQNERNANVPEPVAFHPFDPSIMFFRLDNMIISYCVDDGRLKRVQLRGQYVLGGKDGSNLPEDRTNRLFPYCSPIWASFYL